MLLLALLPFVSALPMQERQLGGLLGNVLSPVTNVLAPVTDLLDPITAMLGIHLSLSIGESLTCNNVNGTFGGRDYELGCTCTDESGGLLLSVDVDAVVNVEGLEAWIVAQVDLGLNFNYPAGAQPTCDGNGGYQCPGGNCAAVSSAPPSSSEPCTESWSSTAVESFATPRIAVAASSTPPAPVSSSWTSSWTPTPVAVTTPPPVNTFAVASATPTTSAWEDDEEWCDDDEDDQVVNVAVVADTTITLSTVYVVETTVTVTSTATTTVTETGNCDPGPSINVAVASSAPPAPPTSSTPPPSSTVNVAVPSASASESPCPSGQTYDIELQICVDLCLLGICADLDADVGLNVTGLLDGLL